MADAIPLEARGSPTCSHAATGGELVLQRQLGEWVASSFVVAEAGLVLSSASEAGPGPDVVGGVGDTQDEFGEQAPDLR
jgi:hypothetical protein